MRHDRHFVEELSNHSVTAIGLMIPIGQIAPNPEQPRADMGALDDLTASIRDRGLLEPLVVRRQDGEGTQRFQIVAGERRFQAALLAGLTELPCIEITATDQEAVELALVENLQRRDLSPFEEAEGFATLVEKYGYTHDSVARAVGRSRSTVTETLKLLAIPPAIRDLCRHADISAKSMLLLIARASSIAEMEQLVQEIAEGGLDREAARVRSQDLRESGELPSSGDSDEADVPGRDAWRPVQIRYRAAADAPIHLALSLRKPGITRNEIIATLEDLLERVRRGELDERLAPRD